MNTMSTIASQRQRKASQPRLSESLLYWSLVGTLLVFSFYVYGLALNPMWNYLKDILLTLVAGITVVDLFSRRSRRPLTQVDLSVFLLLVYLLFQLIYTRNRIDSLTVAYLGFRLDFMPILLYFGCRRLENEYHRRSLHKWFLILLIVGMVHSLVEFGLTVSGLVSRDFFFELLKGPEDRRGISLGNIPRIFGIAGTPHITGIHHLVLLTQLLYFPKRPPKKNSLCSHSQLRVWLLVGLQVLTVIATIVSTSKTAWVILPVLIGLVVISQPRIRLKTIGSAAVLIAIGALLVYILVFRNAEQRAFVFEKQFLGFLEVYREWILLYSKDVLRDSPIIGYGYAYDTRFTPFTAPKITAQNWPLQADIYFVELFRMLGGIGILLFMVPFGLLPLRRLLLSSGRHAQEQKGAALGVLSIGLAFAHYSPLTSPAVSLAAWYLMARMVSYKSLQRSKLIEVK